MENVNMGNKSTISSSDFESPYEYSSFIFVNLGGANFTVLQ